MRQTTLSVPLEVKPESSARLTDLIEALRQREETPPLGHPQEYARIMRDVPSLHFMSMSVFPSHDYDPLFILEANFDGPSGAFWGQIEAAFGEDLRAMLRCCKRPLDRDGPLYDAVTAPDSRLAVAPYFEARTMRPSVFHHGNRGMTRDRILDEAALFLAIRDELHEADSDGPSPYRGASAAEAHQKLRAALLPAFPWLDHRAPKRIPLTERATDIVRLLLFAVAAVFIVSLPGIILQAFMRTDRYLIALIGLMIAIVVLLFLKRKPLPGTEAPGKFRPIAFLLRHSLLIVLMLGAYLLIAVPVATGLHMLFRGLGAEAAWQPALRAVLLGLAFIPLALLALVLRLRYLERRDSWHDAPHTDEQSLREMVRREDWIAQNHMGSIVLIKPGVLRSIIIHAGHLGLGLLLRVKATDGYLGSMRTVHFAHWAFLNNHSRLLFFSNFDHSWDSYLDDFIEKAHAGLTLAWGCGVGFPPTRFLVLDGASHGRMFKAWALASRAVSRFWYSAYKDLTVDQIERNARIATGLRRKSMTEKEAGRWMLDL
ncbi:hypothetical protein [Sphingosinicella sp. CPCC 101087]|uniref:hypothetical protein n=1 Tax=Sphingosinicella sp. CPCC 101087 TaxID=2497754 RepID=UPI00101DB16E|nr:hypothetical protein [Sphingosinicella sp. CPCC 101087]